MQVFATSRSATGSVTSAAEVTAPPDGGSPAPAQAVSTPERPTTPSARARRRDNRDRLSRTSSFIGVLSPEVGAHSIALVLCGVKAGAGRARRRRVVRTLPVAGSGLARLPAPTAGTVGGCRSDCGLVDRVVHEPRLDRRRHD